MYHRELLLCPGQCLQSFTTEANLIKRIKIFSIRKKKKKKMNLSSDSWSRFLSAIMVSSKKKTHTSY